MTKPLFMWAGGKNKMLKHYKPLMPSSVKSYCEPFFGGGAMFIYVMNTYSLEYARINDINPDIMRIYTSRYVMNMHTTMSHGVHHMNPQLYIS